MLVGEFTHTLDEKKRLSLPAKFRNGLGNSVILTRGLDGCLFIYSTHEWSTFASQLRELSVGSSDSRAFSRYLLSGAVETEIDSSGRILIPEYLKEFAQLTEKVVITGVGNRVELWAQEQWSIYSRGMVEHADELAEKLSQLGMV